MSNLLFESILLDVDFSTHSVSLPEWEGSSLTTTNNFLEAMSVEFFLSYFSFFSSTVYVNAFVDVSLETYVRFAMGQVTSDSSENVLGTLYLSQWALHNLYDFMPVWHILNYKNFFELLNFNTIFFSDVLTQSLYLDFMRSFYDFYSNALYQGSFVTSYTVQVRWLFEFVYSADFALLLVELLALLLVLNVNSRVGMLFSNVRTFYDDIVTFCKTNNISLTEVGVFFSFFLGFIIFDIFICGVDEDVTDVFSYFMLTFVILLFFFLILGTDVQYYYMISSISNGDLALRVIAFDVINNFLCVLRIFFCWVRYIFYDLQVELVDFSFHYTDSVNETTILALYDNVSTGWFNDGYITTTDSNLFSVLKTAGWLLIYLYIDISFLIFQMLLSFVKLFIAFFLLWLIVDLFILKAFVHSEAHYLHLLRAATRQKKR